jgi:hypothetical protein
MIRITVDTCKPFSTEQLFLFTQIFEKMSQFSTMCSDCYGQLLPEMIKVSPEDLNLTDVFVHNNMLQAMPAVCTNEEFAQCLINAMHTTVTIEIETDNGRESRTLPLFDGTLYQRVNEVSATWYAEPEFIVRTTDGGALEFEFFDSLEEFVAEDVDGNMTTKMLVGGVEVWSLSMSTPKSLSKQAK